MEIEKEKVVIIYDGLSNKEKKEIKKKITIGCCSFLYDYKTIDSTKLNEELSSIFFKIMNEIILRLPHSVEFYLFIDDKIYNTVNKYKLEYMVFSFDKYIINAHIITYERKRKPHYKYLLVLIDRERILV